MVEVLESLEDAVLLERLSPGTALSELTLAGRDAEATGIVAETVHQLSEANATVEGIPTVEDWGQGFAAYLRSTDSQLDRGLVERGTDLLRKARGFATSTAPAAWRSPALQHPARQPTGMDRDRPQGSPGRDRV
jgi:streptomycin 6-kinase